MPSMLTGPGRGGLRHLFQVTQQMHAGCLVACAARIRLSGAMLARSTTISGKLSRRVARIRTRSAFKADTAGRSALTAPPVAPRKQVRGTVVTGGARMAVQRGAAVVPTATRASVRGVLPYASVTPAGRRALDVH